MHPRDRAQLLRAEGKRKQKGTMPQSTWNKSAGAQCPRDKQAATPAPLPREAAARRKWVEGGSSTWLGQLRLQASPSVSDAAGSHLTRPL